MKLLGNSSCLLHCKSDIYLQARDSFRSNNRHPDVDHEVRWCILKLADLLIRPVEESPPSVKIHIPSTPAIEAPPPLPAVKVPPKLPRVIKAGGPPIKSPLVTTIPSTKLKLPASPHPDAIPVRLPPVPSGEVRKKEVIFAKPELPAKVSLSKPKLKQPMRIPERHERERLSHVPKAQSGGMTLNDLKASRSALKKLKTNKRALIFLQPVDPIRDHAPK